MDVMEDQLKSLSVDFAVFCLILQYHSEEKFQQTMKRCLNEKKYKLINYKNIFINKIKNYN